MENRLDAVGKLGSRSAGPGEQFEVRFAVDESNILIEIDKETLLDFDLAEYADSIPDRIRGVVLGVLPADGTKKKARYDWARLEEIK